MPRLSKLIEKIEDRLANKWGCWYERNKARVPLYAVLGGIGWYLYGMFLNSLKLGKESVFNTTGEVIESIWVFNPFKNLFAVFTPFGLGVSAFIALMVCLITKKGYSWFSGYKFTRDARGFDILPDGTHGTSGFATKKELAEHLELGSAEEVTGMLLGRIKARPDDPEKYATYVAHRMKPGENNNILCIGAPGSYKSRGFIIPFLMGCAQRSSGGHHESVVVTDPKGELFENLAPYFREHGFYVKAVNFLDMAHSDGWNCLAGLEANPDLVTTVANTIIQNTSGPKEADDFWSRAELNLLMALIHYVCNLKDARGNLLPLEQRSLGDVYKILAYKSVNEINRILAELPPEHPAKGPHGLFLKARENLWGNIIIGLGNRLAVFQNPLVDKITRNHDVDLLLPGQKPCAYFVIISAQDSAYRFLSSLFFSLTFPQLSALHKSEPAVQTAGKIPEADIVLLDEIFKCNDGVLNSLLTALNERKYTNEGRTYPIPVISFFAASNEIPNFNDPQEKILEALYDRLELKVVTANMEDRDTRLAVLKNKQTGAFGQISATITLEELRQMQQEVASIPVPDAINELADDILCELRKDMAVSDRKYLGYYPIAQAKAWLSGHDKVESCDLLALKNYLWHLPSDREKVEAVLTRLCVNPMQDKVNNIRGMALESQEEFDAALGDGSKADTARKAFIKLRGELTHLYQMQCSLRTAAQSDSEIALVDDLLADLEKISRKAHEQTHFTYTTLEEIAALN